MEECRKPDSDQANFLVSGCLNKLSEANWLFNLTAVLTDSHNVNCSSEGIQLWPHPSPYLSVLNLANTTQTCVVDWYEAMLCPHTLF